MAYHRQNRTYLLHPLLPRRGTSHTQFLQSPLSPGVLSPSWPEQMNTLLPSDMTQHTGAMNVVQSLWPKFIAFISWSYRTKFSSVPADNTRQHWHRLPRQTLGNSHTEHKIRDFTVFGLSTQTSHFSIYCKQSHSCSFSSCSIHESALTSLPVPLVFLIMSKSFTHIHILFWNAGGIKSKNTNL